MPHDENKVEWCLRKAEKEMKEKGSHRGLARIPPDQNLALAHLKKAEHTVKAVKDFQRMGYSDWSASAAYYAVYHCMLAIGAKHGYESRNHECTYALIRQLMSEKKVGLEKELIDRISRIDPDSAHERPTIAEIREMQQYGISTSLEDETLEKMLETAKKVLELTREEIEK